MQEPQSRQFVIQGKRICAELWGEAGHPVIALHGWLDNCRSFAPLCPLLNNVQVLALDMAGHGHSEHRSADASYHIWDDVREILMVADEMGWEQFTLLGHSRGAIISAIIAAILPERIRKLVLIEGLIPLTVEAEEAPRQLRKFIDAFFQAEVVSKGRKELEPMVEGRTRAGFGLSESAARLLVERNAEQVDGYYYWRTDSRLRHPSPQMLSPQSARAFIDRIVAPTLLVCGDQAMGGGVSRWEGVINGKNNFSVIILPGGHHLHMESACERVAEQVNGFIDRTK